MRSEGTHIGNNILYAACEFCEEIGIFHLNLGVGFFDWKNKWSHDRKKSLKGLRFRSYSPLLNALSDYDHRHSTHGGTNV